ncbi:hypothetical protein G9F71_025175 [Clostridium sp. FP2]|uniref:hypothetical protein n=1 Tax=Clostridium sp. FP2 TaxID=2724481 RepID=UPI0013E937C9|nr:hypothetical protein [Clostridium sp. FP2]MBZ9626101.1 hypothetical protein [Clostridium sp. FP2]
MSDINILLMQQEGLLTKIREIEATCEGIDNEDNAKIISKLNIKHAKFSAEKISLSVKLSNLEDDLNRISEEIRGLSGTGVDRILQAIKSQRWYFFKNKPRVLMDKDTGILWANLDYFDYATVNRSHEEALEITKTLQIDGYSNWDLPTYDEFKDAVYTKTFPLGNKKNYTIKDMYGFHLNKVSDDSHSINLADLTMGNYNEKMEPINKSIITIDYKNNISPTNLVYTEIERLQFTLNIFVNNELWPLFNDDEITHLYKKIYFEKPALLKDLNELQAQIDSLQHVILLSSTFDYNSLLLKYDIKAIDSSIIKYHRAVVSVIDDFMDKLHYYEEIKSEIIRDFNVIGLKLSKKYDENPNLSKDENTLIEKRQIFFKNHFELGMNSVNSKLLAIKRQAQDIEDRLEAINSGDNGLKELAILEKEERASFNFIVENAATIIKNALLKIEYFEENRKFASSAVTLWYSWSEDYKVFKSTLKDDFKNTCEDDSIESEIYNGWYADWQKKRFVVEERFLPLISRGLNGSLIDVMDNETTVSEKVIALLQEYKVGIDKFYLEERKHIYQKFAFQAGGDLQEKFEAESELYKLVSKLQKDLQGIIFSLEKSEDRLFLLKWAEKLLDLQVDDILDFVKNKELSKISLNVLTEFADLKRKNFEVYISDSKAYSEELQRREKEYNALIFKMRKELMK